VPERLDTIKKPRHIFTVSILLFAGSLLASAEESTPSTESLVPENSEEECYCSVRKRQQVEMRLKKKKELEQE
jgi:hypothetical protein